MLGVIISFSYVMSLDFSLISSSSGFKSPDLPDSDSLEFPPPKTHASRFSDSVFQGEAYDWCKLRISGDLVGVWRNFRV
ncbi:unnamed protein product [Microthlaspi erraticum]|uniref:Uncharacterized protein n=1 Tax=Microthlaspi erraticum TaxID=1685480 RepID=A0A6D2J556_9BRAS|nr:unnamed protein product [Microthlaspi erraticum]